MQKLLVALKDYFTFFPWNNLPVELGLLYCFIINMLYIILKQMSFLKSKVNESYPVRRGHSESQSIYFTHFHVPPNTTYLLLKAKGRLNMTEGKIYSSEANQTTPSHFVQSKVPTCKHVQFTLVVFNHCNQKYKTKKKTDLQFVFTTDVGEKTHLKH